MKAHILLLLEVLNSFKKIVIFNLKKSYKYIQTTVLKLLCYAYKKIYLVIDNYKEVRSFTIKLFIPMIILTILFWCLSLYLALQPYEMRDQLTNLNNVSIARATTNWISLVICFYSIIAFFCTYMKIYSIFSKHKILNYLILFLYALLSSVLILIGSERASNSIFDLTGYIGSNFPYTQLLLTVTNILQILSFISFFIFLVLSTFELLLLASNIKAKNIIYTISIFFWRIIYRPIILALILMSLWFINTASQSMNKNYGATIFSSLALLDFNTNETLMNKCGFNKNDKIMLKRYKDDNEVLVLDYTNIFKVDIYEKECLKTNILSPFDFQYKSFSLSIINN
ncbi:hypothetical protein [Francisella philomiragia]|uniref:Putative membrane protein n=1 Tax=Francisella philomiragia TaxID=28110 RepID=A0A0B6CQN7_9GAMM|nr:hypothetical protein [Francisella philomiragia]AJI52784.1 putative membrane protein [Francisella philomiragia]